MSRDESRDHYENVLCRRSHAKTHKTRWSTLQHLHSDETLMRHGNLMLAKCQELADDLGRADVPKRYCRRVLLPTTEVTSTDLLCIPMDK